MPLTPSGLFWERTSPRATSPPRPVLLLHAGIADSRMWAPQWSSLADIDLVRLDLRGFGRSDRGPTGPLDPVADVLEVMAEAGVRTADVVAASFGAGVAVELALTRPEAVASLFLAAPGGSLIAAATDDLEEFATAEEGALEAGDLDSAADANVRSWVDGPGGSPDRVASDVRFLVHRMQRRAFEITLAWDDVEEVELEPPALDRLDEIIVPTTVLTGGLDVAAIRLSAVRVAAGISGSTYEEWPDVAHLPSLERPDDFTERVRTHLSSVP